MTTLIAVLFLVVLLSSLLYGGHGWRAWVVTAGAVMVMWGYADPNWWLWWLGAVGMASALMIFAVPETRREVLTPRIMPIMEGVLPTMSETERAALEAGSVGWDAELFSGDPDWQQLLGTEIAELSEDERAFLEGPIEELCGLLDDHKITQDGDLPDEVWDFISSSGLLGMIIPKAYGGLEFSGAAHSAVIARLAGRSVAAAVTVMVPNSLGPGELLLKYGTDAQKDHYLPRLARGEEIPCFALTGPENGSDAAAMSATGTICRGEYEGDEVLGMRLGWDKRYTTLGPRATVIGLAFRLLDPDHLLGEEEDLGITCALIPAGLPGIEIGARHDPMGLAFLNGPNQGHDVFVPLDAIIGGPERAGQGWRMLMECLAAGRGISVPSLAVGAAQYATRLSAAYTTVREQFGLPVSRFEGVAERLARMAGLTYAMDATRRLTVGAIDAGEHPAVTTAIAKATLTECMRTVVNDGMDVLGGAGLSRGPRNGLARLYQAVPIGITVEGANILTRSLIIYGQGAIRCHAWVQKEMETVAARDLDGFDEAFFSHLALVAENGGRALILGLTGSRVQDAPVEGPMAPYFRHFTRMSAAFATASETAMGTLGGSLKRREMLSGRLADALSWLYLGSATLKRYVDDGQPVLDEPVARWALDHALHQIQTALGGLFDNLPNRAAAHATELLIFPYGRRFRAPSDAISQRAAHGLVHNRALRERLTGMVYLPPADEPGLGQIEAAFEQVSAAAMLRQKVKNAIKNGSLAAEPVANLYDRAVAAKILNEPQRDAILEANKARQETIQVDAFAAEAFAELVD